MQPIIQLFIVVASIHGAYSMENQFFRLCQPSSEKFIINSKFEKCPVEVSKPTKCPASIYQSLAAEQFLEATVCEVQQTTTTTTFYFFGAKTSKTHNKKNNTTIG